MSISKVGTYAFYKHPNLERAVVSASVIETNAFQNATKLEVADLTSEAAVSIAANAFNGCYEHHDSGQGLCSSSVCRKLKSAVYQ